LVICIGLGIFVVPLLWTSCFSNKIKATPPTQYKKKYSTRYSMLYDACISCLPAQVNIVTVENRLQKKQKKEIYE
jgi:hypothetical protein